MMMGPVGVPLPSGGPEIAPAAREPAAERPGRNGSGEPVPVAFAAFLAALAPEVRRDPAADALLPGTVALEETGSADVEPVPAADDVVAPELLRRLERVIRRMEALGHTVQVVEGYRTQARQDELWSQGRDAPGPLVTWTRSSLHTQGRAVDVQVDGSWTDLEAYRTLQRVAREEGLATLGMRDPGHLELPDDVPSARPGEAWAPPAWGRSEAMARPEAVRRPSPEGRPAPAWAPERGPAPPAGTRTFSPASPPPPAVAVPARVAPVAPVAGVADPARTAPVARPAPVPEPGGVVTSPGAPEGSTRDGATPSGVAERPEEGGSASRRTLFASAARAPREAPAATLPTTPDARPSAPAGAHVSGATHLAGDPAWLQAALPAADARRLAGAPRGSGAVGSDAASARSDAGSGGPATVRGEGEGGEPRPARSAAHGPGARAMGGEGEGAGSRFRASPEPDAPATEPRRSPGGPGAEAASRTAVGNGERAARGAELPSWSGPRGAEAPSHVATGAGVDGGLERTPLTGPGPADPSSAAEQAARIQELQARARVAGGRVHLELHDLDGDGTNLRMRLQGARVATTLEFRDPDLTTHARTQVDELHRSLERAGLEPESLVLRSGEPAASEDRGQRGRGGAWDGSDPQRDERPRRDGRDDLPDRSAEGRFPFLNTEEER